MNANETNPSNVNGANSTTDAIVSVVVPVFNAARTLERTVCSILEQNVPVQIILINDASTDSSASVIQEITEEYKGYFTVVQSENNKGVSHARNLGIAEATADYLAFLDSDDIWLPGKLEMQLEAIRSNPDVLLVTCDSFQVHPDGRVLSRNHELHKTQNGKDAWKELLKQNFIPTPTVLTLTQLVRDLAGFNTELTVSEDLDLWIRIAKTGDICVVSEVLVHYFDYSKSLMKRGGYDQGKMIMDMLESHFNDERLTTNERKHLMSCRFVEMSKGIGHSNPKKMTELLNKAREHGYSSSAINRLKLIRSVKRFLRSLKST